MTNTVSRRTLPIGQEHETLLALERAGYNEADAKVFINAPNNGLAKIVVATIRRRGIPLSTDERVVRAVMGPERFWGTDLWTTRPYNLAFSKQQLEKIAKVPWSEEILNGPCDFYPNKRVRDTHFLYASVAHVGAAVLDLVALRNLHLGSEHPKIWGDWQDKEDFAKIGFTLRWHLALIGSVPGTTSMPYADRVKLLHTRYPAYEVPKAGIRVLGNLLYRRVAGVYLDPDIWVAVDDTDNGGNRVVVGGNPTVGVYVNSFGVVVVPGVGLAAEREFSLVLNS